MQTLAPSLAHLRESKFYLGSASPRRAQLLEGLNIPFEIRVSSDPEIVPEDIPYQEHATYLSRLKNDTIRSEISFNDILITADTVVIHDDRILNKPETPTEARAMLQLLSDSKHEVHTGLTVSRGELLVSQSDVALVQFCTITPIEIDYYVDSYQPLDKAGAYGIQEWIGMACIEKIEGSFYTIMGLPTHLLYEILKSRF